MVSDRVEDLADQPDHCSLDLFGWAQRFELIYPGYDGQEVKVGVQLPYAASARECTADRLGS